MGSIIYADAQKRALLRTLNIQRSKLNAQGSGRLRSVGEERRNVLGAALRCPAADFEPKGTTGTKGAKISNGRWSLLFLSWLEIGGVEERAGECRRVVEHFQNVVAEKSAVRSTGGRTIAA